MKKILIFQPALAPYRIDFLNLLAERFEVSLCVLNKNLDSQTFNQEKLLARLRVKVSFLLSGFRIGGRLLRLGILRKVREEAPDIVCSYEYSLVTLVLLIYKRLSARPWKLIVMTDDNLEMLETQRGVRRLIRSGVLSWIDGVVVTSAASRDWMRARLSPYQTVSVIPIIHGERELRKEQTHILAIAKGYCDQYALVQKKVVLFVARFHPVKNVPFLLKAFAAVTDKDALLVLVGQGPEEACYRDLIGRLGIGSRVLLPGRLEGNPLYAWYALANLLVLPSQYEPFGAVVNEALIFGAPCLVAEHVGAKSLLSDPAQGAIFSLGDPQQLAKLIDRYLQGAEPVRTERPSLMSTTLPMYVEKLASEWELV